MARSNGWRSRGMAEWQSAKRLFAAGLLAAVCMSVYAPQAHAFAEGTFVRNPGGAVYRVVGGAPIFVSNWSVYGGAQPVTNVSYPEMEAMRPWPADGTFVDTAQDGAVYRFAGGAPIYVSTWNTYGGPQPSLTIDRWAMDNITHPHARMRAVPLDGTLINTPQDGRVYRIAGGAPTYVSHWDAIGGPQPSVGIDVWAVANATHPAAHLRPFPADGTVLRTSTGRLFRTAGGTPFPVLTPSLFSGSAVPVLIDQWAVDNVDQVPAHLRSRPVDDTVLVGLPSGSAWRVNAGRKTAAARTAGAIEVEDAALGLVPDVMTATGAGTVQRGDRATFTVRGTGFAADDTVTTSAPGVTIAARAFDRTDQFTLTVEAARDSGLGPQDITITGQDGASFLCRGCLEVTRGDTDAAVTINDGAIYTRTPKVKLTISAPAGTTAIRAANDGGFGDPFVAQLPIANPLPWTLSSSGRERLPKTVYVRFLGSGIDATQTYTDDIILDQTPPKLKKAAVIRRGGGGVRTIAMSASDAVSGVASAQFAKRVSKPGARVPFRSRLKTRLRGRLYVRVLDKAGNAGKWQAVRGSR